MKVESPCQTIYMYFQKLGFVRDVELLHVFIYL
jgi:hypothetical protein